MQPAGGWAAPDGSSSVCCQSSSTARPGRVWVVWAGALQGSVAGLWVRLGRLLEQTRRRGPGASWPSSDSSSRDPWPGWRSGAIELLACCLSELLSLGPMASRLRLPGVSEAAVLLAALLEAQGSRRLCLSCWEPVGRCWRTRSVCGPLLLGRGARVKEASFRELSWQSSGSNAG